jgi:DNA helicase HerA-like ATPase
MTTTGKPQLQKVGSVLSGGTTSEAAFQPLEPFESGMVEGKLVIVHCPRGDLEILGRVASIIPHNVFYSEGDAFSEARRKGLPIPAEIAKQYQVCRIDLLQTINRGPATAVTFPPHPGDAVYLYDPSQHEEKLFGIRRGSGDDRHIWFGTQIGYTDAPVALNVENMPMHMAVFGVTGSGKSYDTGALIERLSSIPCPGGAGPRRHLPYPMLIIDANGDYADYARANESGAIGTFGQHSIQRIFFPGPFEREQRRGRAGTNLRRLAVNLDRLSSRDLAVMVMEFYRGSSEGVSELGIAGLQRCIDDLVLLGLSQHDLFTTNITNLRTQIENAPQQQISAQTKPSILRALDVFTRVLEQDNQLFTDRRCEWFDLPARIEELTRGGVAILDFSADGATGVDLATKQFVIGYLSAFLFDRFTWYKQREGARYLSFIIEEAQNFCPGKRYPISSSLAKSKLSAIATQGRKFGLSLCLISQRPSFVDEIILSMCNTFFIHRISPEDVSFVRSVTGGLPESLARRLTNLSQGECIVTGQMNRLPFAVLVKVLKDVDRKIPHIAGTTDVVARIAEVRGL